MGLYAAFIVGLITAVFGSRPGMISGATVVLMGVIAFGLLQLGKFIRMVPFPVMIGFVNGLAIMIFLAQLGHLKTPDAAGNPASNP